VPINPYADEILDVKSYKSLLEMPVEVQKTVEIVAVFRPSEDVLPIVEQVIKLKKLYGRPYVVWMQLGIINNSAAENAEKADLTVIMNKCMMREHQHFFIQN
jgi:predicted CoA-binding protein